jgi:hypothetical protein
MFPERSETAEKMKATVIVESKNDKAEKLKFWASSHSLIQADLFEDDETVWNRADDGINESHASIVSDRTQFVVQTETPDYQQNSEELTEPLYAQIT